MIKAMTVSPPKGEPIPDTVEAWKHHAYLMADHAESMRSEISKLKQENNKLRQSREKMKRELAKDRELIEFLLKDEEQDNE